MNEIAYEKIKLFSSSNYLKNKNDFLERQKEIETILIENQIEYVLEITEKYKNKILIYTLNLVIRKEDTQKVKELLKKFYKYIYEILEEQIEEEQMKNEENKEIIDSDAIKMNETIGEKIQDIKEEIEETPTVGKISIIFIFIINVALIVFEIILLIKTEFNWFLLIPMFLQVVIFLSALYDIIGKRGE